MKMKGIKEKKERKLRKIEENKDEDEGKKKWKVRLREGEEKNMAE